jgi:type II secretory pathway predicted ATPase ExeA
MGTSMPNLLIVGESGSGKTTLLREFLSRHPRIEDAQRECSIIRVAYCETPPDPNPGALYNEILQALSLPPSWKNADFRRCAVESALQFLRTGMVVIDEVQHILVAGAKTQFALLNAIKSLSNRGIATVACGTKTAMGLFAKDPQIDRRFERYDIPHWKLDSAFRRLLLTLERNLPLGMPSRLSDRDMATQLYKISRGTIGRLWRAVSEAAVLAIQYDVEHINERILNDVMMATISARDD